jgi:hypothetical protein
VASLTLGVLILAGVGDVVPPLVQLSRASWGPATVRHTM